MEETPQGQEEMIATYFTEDEAEEKIGKKIFTMYEFAGVPKYTTGIVSGMYTSSEGKGLDITWDLPSLCRPLTDGFSKDEYEQFLREIN